MYVNVCKLILCCLYAFVLDSPTVLSDNTNSPQHQAKGPCWGVGKYTPWIPSRDAYGGRFHASKSVCPEGYSPE